MENIESRQEIPQGANARASKPVMGLGQGYAIISRGKRCMQCIVLISQRKIVMSGHSRTNLRAPAIKLIFGYCNEQSPQTMPVVKTQFSF